VKHIPSAVMFCCLSGDSSAV